MRYFTYLGKQIIDEGIIAGEHSGALLQIIVDLWRADPDPGGVVS